MDTPNFIMCIRNIQDFRVIYSEMMSIVSFISHIRAEISQNFPGNSIDTDYNIQIRSKIVYPTMI